MWRLWCCFKLFCGSVCELFKTLLIYLNDLCCFHVLCFMFVLSCGNSPEDYSVFFWGVTTEQIGRYLGEGRSRKRSIAFGCFFWNTQEWLNKLCRRASKICQCNLERRLEVNDNGLPSGTLCPEGRERGKKTCPSSAKLLNRQRHVVSRGCLCTFAKVHLASWRQAVVARNTRRHVLFAHWNKGSGGKRLSRRVLLAFARGGRPWNRTHVPKLLEARPLQQVPARRSPPHTSGLAPRVVGHRHCGSPANS